jgi:hypothetical protein
MAYAREAAWFQRLFGFQETLNTVTHLLRVDTDPQTSFQTLYNEANGMRFTIGRFDCVQLSELRNHVMPPTPSQRLKIDIVQGDISELHAKPEYRLGTFQAASQFNCLEFPSPNTIPEEGVTGYVHDKTQGPACAISCAPALVYRNYFAMNGRPQTRDNQIDCLHDLNQAIQSKFGPSPFHVKNGYIVLSDRSSVQAMNQKVGNYFLHFDGLLRIGIHRDVQVVSKAFGDVLVEDPNQIVTQVYCAACPIGYNASPAADWEPFARLILENSYEATFIAAIQSYERHHGQAGSDRLVLTLVGGGVFKNPLRWIYDAILNCCKKYHHYPLKVSINSYSTPPAEMQQFVQQVTHMVDNGQF